MTALTCTACDWTGSKDQADTEGMDRRCPDCGEPVRLYRGDD